MKTQITHHKTRDALMERLERKSSKKTIKLDRRAQRRVRESLTAYATSSLER